MTAPLPTLPQGFNREGRASFVDTDDMPEQFFCAGCGEEISGEFCDEDGHWLCRGCDREQQMESAADRRAER